RYSDRLGYEPVPMIDDLYDDRLAAADFGCLLAGLVSLVAADLVVLPRWVALGGGVLTLAGIGLFVANVLLVIRRHSPQSILGVLFGTTAIDTGQSPSDASEVSSGVEKR
ncbi:MAG: hypothetical protein ACOCR0_02295, partial [Haloferacaceae archaeon]